VREEREMGGEWRGRVLRGGAGVWTGEEGEGRGEVGVYGQRDKGGE